jgi:hypothetical protein
MHAQQYAAARTQICEDAGAAQVDEPHAANVVLRKK